MQENISRTGMLPYGDNNKRHGGRSLSLGRLWRRVRREGKELLLVSVAAAILFVLHSHFGIRDMLGEQDSARLANAAIALRYRPGAVSSYYGFRSSPLYIRLLALCLKVGLPVSQLPWLMNRINLYMGSLIVFPLYYLVKRLFNARVASLTLPLIAFTPVFWLGSIYGFPNLPAYAFLLSSFLLFLKQIEAENILRRVLFAAGAALSMIIALGLKVDVVLAVGGFFGIVWAKRRASFQNLAAACGIVFLAVAAYFIIARSMPQVHSDQNELAFFQKWSAQFPFINIASFWRYRGIIISAFGFVILSACGFACLYILLFCRQYARHLAALTLWGLPTVVFWGMIYPNSARHNFFASVPLAAAIAACIADVFKSSKAKMSFCCLAVLATNYFSMPPTSAMVSPSTRIFESARLIENYLKTLQPVGPHGAFNASIAQIASLGEDLLAVGPRRKSPELSLLLGANGVAKIFILCQEGYGAEIERGAPYNGWHGMLPYCYAAPDTIFVRIYCPVSIEGDVCLYMIDPEGKRRQRIEIPELKYSRDIESFQSGVWIKNRVPSFATADGEIVVKVKKIQGANAVLSKLQFYKTH